MVGGNTRVVGTMVLAAVAPLGLSRMWARAAEGEAGAGPTVEVRGIYGGVPAQILERGRSLSDCGINAVWVGTGGLAREDVALLRRQGAKVLVEFNSPSMAL